MSNEAQKARKGGLGSGQHLKEKTRKEGEWKVSSAESELRMPADPAEPHGDFLGLPEW